MMDLKDLLLKSEEIKRKKLVVGYDGFIDTTVRLVRQAATEATPPVMFETIKEFGEFLISKAGKSCSVELQVESRHSGGNMPYLTRGAGILGLDVTSIGMMGGNGRVEEPFSNLPCNPYSFAPPGESTCMEFRDGKVLLAPSYTLPSDGWDMILKATDGKAVDWIRDADVLALVNWSELSFSHLLWERTYEHGLKESDCNKHKIAFFDLCDISRKTNQEIDGVLKLIGWYSQKRRTILSLNENEALIIGQALGSAMQQLEKLGKGLRFQYKIDEILIHTRKKSLLLTNRGCYHRETIFVENPKLSTGAGDHFNAASCLGAVMELTEEQRLKFANQFTSLYVTTGKTPTLEQTVMWDEEI